MVAKKRSASCRFVTSGSGGGGGLVAGDEQK